MCATCGCSGSGVRVIVPGHAHDHDHAPGPVPADNHTHIPGPVPADNHTHIPGPVPEDNHTHIPGPVPADNHTHIPGPAPEDDHHPRGSTNVPHASVDRTHTIAFEQAVLAKNDALADANRRWLTDRGILALNLMSSPGAGKTTLLIRTIEDLAASPEPLAVSVVEGDQETLLDAERISDTGCRVVQINTGSGCHLDATMVERGLRTLMPPAHSVLFIENVGNLVCPALFDLGEAARVVIASTTEGEDKPLKYPRMFAAADLVVLNKVDLLPHLSFDVARWLAGARQVNPGVEVLELSATSGAGLADWYGWLRRRVGPGAGRHRTVG